MTGDVKRIVMNQRMRVFFADETGASAVEYAIIVSGISVILIAAATGIAPKLFNEFFFISSHLPGQSAVVGP